MGRSFLLALLLLTGLLLPGLANAQAMPDGAYNIWLAEQFDPPAPLYDARIAGAAHYGHFDAKAPLAFFCGTGGPKSGVWAKLAMDVKALDFDNDPYEGPSATMNGPVTIMIGDPSVPKKPSIQRPVSGFFSDGGLFDTGTPFIFSFCGLPMAQWVVPAMHSKTLAFTRPSAKHDMPIAFHFRRPEDDAVLERVITLCL